MFLQRLYALLAALSMGLPLLIVGYSLLEGVGSALLIPPIYILVTVAFPDIKSRARYFGVVSGAGGLGAAAGPKVDQRKEIEKASSRRSDVIFGSAWASGHPPD